MKPLHLPAKTALLLALFAGLALLVSIGGLALVDRDARRIGAAEGAARDLAALDAKLPGVLDDRAAAPLLAHALAEIGRYAGDTGQPRVVLLRDAAGRVDGTWRIWPRTHRYRDGYVRAIGPGGTEVIGVARALPAGAALLVARPVASNSPLRRSLGLWGGEVALVLIVLAITTALLVGGQVAARIRRLNAVCDRVGAGDVSARIDDIGPGDEIGILARHMNGMLGELERRIGALREASDHIAHDLRTPLARVRARISGMENAGDPAIAADAALAGASLDRLMEAFNGLLELREIETDVGEPAAEFDVCAAIDDAVELYEALAEDSKAVRFIHCTEGLDFVGHRALVVRAVANLLDNALKVSPPGGTITIDAAFVDAPEPCLRIGITDQGPGFAAPTPGRPSTLGGHGLGLTIVRAIAARHRGTLAVDRVAAGTRVTLTLRPPRLLG